MFLDKRVIGNLWDGEGQACGFNHTVRPAFWYYCTQDHLVVSDGFSINYLEYVVEKYGFIKKHTICNEALIAMVGWLGNTKAYGVTSGEISELFCTNIYADDAIARSRANFINNQHLTIRNSGFLGVLQDGTVYFLESESVNLEDVDKKAWKLIVRGSGGEGYDRKCIVVCPVHVQSDPEEEQETLPVSFL